MTDLKLLEVQLNSFEFDQVEDYLKDKSFEEKNDVLNGLSYNNENDKNNILVYTFLLNVIRKSEHLHWHLLASKIMGISLNHIQSAERVGLYHGLKALTLDSSNVDIKEYLLYYNHIPEQELDDQSAIKLAQEIIKVRPDSRAAQVTLSKVS